VRQRPVSPFAHQTGPADFRHPAFRLISSQSFRWRAEVSIAEAKLAELTEGRLRWKTVGALRGYLVAPCQAVSDALMDMIVDRPVGHLASVRSHLGWVCFNLGASWPWLALYVDQRHQT